MADIKVVCLTEASSDFMSKKFNEASSEGLNFTSVSIDDIDSVSKDTDMFVLGAPYTKDIVNVVEGKIGDTKLVCFDKFQFKAGNIEDMIDHIEDML